MPTQSVVFWLIAALFFFAIIDGFILHFSTGPDPDDKNKGGEPDDTETYLSDNLTNQSWKSHIRQN